MRILTVRQPWAWAIIHGGKDVENRPRNLAGGYRGAIAIHAGLQADPAGDPRWLRAPIGYRLPDAHRLAVRGTIVGVVDLVDVHRGHQQEDAESWEPDEYCAISSFFGPHPKVCSPWAEPAAYHLVLANPRPLAEPIPYRGALGLRKLDAETTARIEAAVR